MAEPAEKRLKSSLPVCTAHRSSVGISGARHNLQAAVEEALCGVNGLLWDGAYRLQALARVFERDDVALQRVAWFFQQEGVKQEKEAQDMGGYLGQRGGHCCGKDVQKPVYESVCGVLPALDLFLLQLKEEIAALIELTQLARSHGDPHTASVVKGNYLSPRFDRLKLVGDVITNGRRLGCSNELTTGLGEFILNELQEELSR